MLFVWVVLINPSFRDIQCHSDFHFNNRNIKNNTCRRSIKNIHFVIRSTIILGGWNLSFFWLVEIYNSSDWLKSKLHPLNYNFGIIDWYSSKKGLSFLIQSDIYIYNLFTPLNIILSDLSKYYKKKILRKFI
jgi:hypothetical protein